MEKKSIPFNVLNRKGGAAFLGAMVLATSLTGGSANAAVTSILDAPNASLPTADQKAPAKYEFIAQFNPELTQIDGFGGTWGNIGFGGDPAVNAEKYITLMNPTDAQKGDIGVTYTNIGMYNGRQLDLNITVNDWESIYGNGAGRISFATDQIAFVTRGLNDAKTTWQFLDHETGKPVTVDGYMTIKDIDENQMLTFSADTMSHVDKIYVPTQDTKVSYLQNTDGSAAFYSELNGNDGTNWQFDPYDPDEKRGDFTFLYSGTDHLDFTWTTQYTDAQMDASMAKSPTVSDLNDDGRLGAFFSYSALKPVATELLLPNKTVTDDNEQDVKTNTLQKGDELNMYEVSHTVPAEIKDFYYQSYEVTDTLPADLIAKGKPVVKDETGKDVTDQFDITVDGADYAFKATSAFVASDAFYNHTYIFAIPTTIAPDKVAATQPGDTLTFDNTANVTVDGVTKASNKTVTTFVQPQPPTTETPADPSTTETPSTEAPSTEAPTTEAPTTEKPTTEAPTTEAPTTEAPTTEAPTTEAPTTEAPVEKLYNLEGIVFIDKDEDGKRGDGEVIVPDVTVKVTDENGDVVKEVKTDKDGHYDVTDLAPGKYHVDFETPADYTGTTPDAVDVVIVNKDERADYGINKPEPTTIDKSVVYHDVKGDSAIIEDNTDYQYTLDVNITDSVNASVVISDDLVDELNAKSARVLDADGKDITADGELKIDEEKENVVWTAKDGKSLAGKQLQLEITAEIKAGADLAKYEKDGVILIPNTGTVTVDGEEPIQSDIVNVTPLEKPSETTVMKFVSRDTVQVGEDYNYQVKGHITDSKKTETIVVTDDLVDELNLIEAKVLDAEGKDVTDQGTLDIDKDKEIVTWTPKDVKAFIGKDITLDIQSEVKTDADLTKYEKDGVYIIPNTAKIIVDGKDIESNKVDVKVPVVKAEVDKAIVDGTKLVDLKETKKGEDVQYALTYVVPNGTALSNLTFSDDLEDVTDLKGAKVYMADVKADEVKTDVKADDATFVDETATTEAPTTEAPTAEAPASSDSEAVFSTDGLKDITDQGKLSIDKEKEVFSWTPNAPHQLAGQKVIVVVDGAVKKDADLKDYKDGLIPNVSEMHYTAAGEKSTLQSEPVNVKVTEPKAEAPTTEAPTTEAPTTEAPTTEAPTTEAPVQKPAPQPIAKVLPNTGSAAGNIALYGGILGIAAYGIYRVARRKEV